ncbi:DUF5050 domain-containing protein [Eubacterium oxidoreducens]|uniref:Prolow-density lipoprotein receptor-related protein 1-like beta-propeller domain-containing protein n=1 Tax=Eubacterium oxidoreducens TaxID=1732 RepID=A0A1G6AP43_EUBOX|nr:DUF5050 domain-containing protein [Eubacterium oxidoreducens]SDB10121.1 protein of unknown function [Eubacterium oxidoreducens]
MRSEVRKFLIIIIIVVAGVIALLVFKETHNFTKLNDEYVNGNTDGNLYNYGLFCEYEDTIYFANPSDNFRLYSMDFTGNNLQKLCDDAVYSINADANYLYLIRDNSESTDYMSFMHYNNYALYRCEHDGSNMKVMDANPCLYASLVGNYIYYLHYDDEVATKTYRVCINLDDPEEVFNEPNYTCSTKNESIYYVGTDHDHDIHKLNTETNTKTTIKTGNYWLVQENGGFLYYLDNTDGYKLKRVLLSDPQNSEETLVNGWVENYNTLGNILFYQYHENSGTNSGLYRMDLSTLESTLIISGEYKNINCTSTYTYFQDYNDSKTMYMVPTSGNTAYSVFSP